jgi:S1-C subfamily serine protease
MKSIILLSILTLLCSCDMKQGESSDLFGGESKDTQSSDWFGGIETTPKKKKRTPVNHQPKQDNKTIGEKLLDVSVGIYVYNADGNLISTGSGAFIKPDLIVTNVHVIEGFSTIVAYRNSDEKKINVAMFKVDPIHDVAILKTNRFKSDKYLNIKTKFPHVGNDVWVAGAPEGLDGTISNGIISAIRKAKPYDFDLIQFTAPISFGSSGGPLINPGMDLIGITVSGIDRNDAQNLNFAVPAKYISHLLDEENN